MKAAILALSLAACAAPRHEFSARGGALVFAPPESAGLIRDTVERYEPEVIERLGTAWSGPYEIRVCQLPPGVRGDSDDETKLVRVSDQLAGDALVETVVHEMVHVHAIAQWERMPFAVQEGLAYWVSLSLTKGVDQYAGPEPERRALELALTLTRDEYQAREQPLDIVQAATWLASRLTR